MAIALVQVGGEVLGALYVTLLPEHRFGADELEVLELLAAHAGMALHHVALYRATERARQESAAVIAAMADGVAVVEADGTVRSWNGSMARLTGWPAERAVGRPVPFSLPDVGEVLTSRPESRRWLDVVVSPAGAGGERVVSARDVTAAKELEAAQELFLATASHELRTPLTVLRGFGETLLRHWDVLDEEQRRELVQRMLVRSEGMSGLVEQVLSATAAGLTTATATPEPFDLAGVTRAASRSLAGASAGHPLTVHAEGRVGALGRPETVAALLDQLVENAVKYSPDGGAVHVHVHAEPDAAVLSVADRGSGIRPADVERVFERFQRGQQSARGPAGAGLGLWIVRRTVQAQGGTVSAAPREGGGTVVTVRLPRSDDAGSTAGDVAADRQLRKQRPGERVAGGPGGLDLRRAPAVAAQPHPRRTRGGTAASRGPAGRAYVQRCTLRPGRRPRRRRGGRQVASHQVGGRGVGVVEVLRRRTARSSAPPAPARRHRAADRRRRSSRARRCRRRSSRRTTRPSCARPSPAASASTGSHARSATAARSSVSDGVEQAAPPAGRACASTTASYGRAVDGRARARRRCTVVGRPHAAGRRAGPRPASAARRARRSAPARAWRSPGRPGRRRGRCRSRAAPARARTQSSTTATKRSSRAVRYDAPRSTRRPASVAARPSGRRHAPPVEHLAPPTPPARSARAQAAPAMPAPTTATRRVGAARAGSPASMPEHRTAAAVRPVPTTRASYARRARPDRRPEAADQHPPSPARPSDRCAVPGRRRRRRARSSAAREPCPCGSGKRYKACHGTGVRRGPAPGDPAVRGPRGRDRVGGAARGRAGRDGAAAAAGGRRPRGDRCRPLLPLAWPALVRARRHGAARAAGAVALGRRQPRPRRGARAGARGRRRARRSCRPGCPVRVRGCRTCSPTTRSRSRVHDGFDYWVEGAADPDGEVAASMERANASVIPTARLASVPSAYWCRMGDKTHLRLGAARGRGPAARRAGPAGRRRRAGLGPDSRYVGLVPRPRPARPGVGPAAATGRPSALEEPAAALRARLDEALRPHRPLTAEERRARAGLLSRQLTLR